MNEPRTVTVILTRGLLEHLRRQAERERVPVSWLVAGRLGPAVIGVEHGRRATWGVAGAAIGPMPSPCPWN